MSGVQVVGPSQALDNTQVVETGQDYTLGKLDLVIISTATVDISCTLPPNPEAGESHKFATRFTGGIFLVPNAGQAIIFNPAGTPFTTATVGVRAFLAAAKEAELVWNNQGSWVTSCCITNNPIT